MPASRVLTSLILILCRYVEGLLLCESIVRRAYNRDPFNPKVKDINSISSARSVDCHSLVPGDFMAGKIDC